MVSTPEPTVTQARGLRLDVTESIDALAPEWSELASAGQCLFGTPEFVAAWHATYGGRSRLYLVTARDDAGTLRALVPFVHERRGPLRIVRFAGYGVADILGPVVRTDEAAIAAPVLDRALHECLPGWDVFLGERMRAAQGWVSVPDAVVLRTEANPVVRLADWPDWDAYLASLPKKLRSELRHDGSLLAEKHGLTVRSTTDPSRLEGDLDLLFALHVARFGPRSSFAPREALHRRFAASALEMGWLRLSILELDGRPAAARYDFSHGGVYYAFNAGRDQAWSRLSVGIVLRAHTMRAAFDEGASVYRFLRGNEAYKSRFASTDDALVTIALARTWLGRRAVTVGRRVRHKRRVRSILGMGGPRPGAPRPQPGEARTRMRSSVMSSIAQRKPSRPSPESLTPP